jgi:hypothetical protein
VQGSGFFRKRRICFDFLADPDPCTVHYFWSFAVVVKARALAPTAQQPLAKTMAPQGNDVHLSTKIPVGVLPPPIPHLSLEFFSRNFRIAKSKPLRKQCKAKETLGASIRGIRVLAFLCRFPGRDASLSLRPGDAAAAVRFLSEKPGCWAVAKLAERGASEAGVCQEKCKSDAKVVQFQKTREKQRVFR